MKTNHAAFDFLSERMPEAFKRNEVTQYQYLRLLMDFEDFKGVEALEKLAGFYVYATDNMKPDEATKAINQVFSHDLYGAKDEWMLPRSDNYLKFWNEYKIA